MTNGASAGAGMATGLATGIAIGVMMEEEEKAKQRRLSHMGKDQILLTSKNDISTVGLKLAGMYPSWYYQDKAIYHLKSWEDNVVGGIGTAIIITFVVALAQVLIFIGLLALFGYTAKYPLNPVEGLIFSIGVGIVGGLGVGVLGSDEKIEYISLSKAKGKTRILVKIYGSSGHRNLDEDELAEIYDVIGEQA